MTTEEPPVAAKPVNRATRITAGVGGLVMILMGLGVAHWSITPITLYAGIGGLFVAATGRVPWWFRLPAGKR